MLSDNDKRILQEIISKDGACLDSKRCAQCPFKSLCLPGFLGTVPPSTKLRFQMAVDVLSNHLLLGDYETVEEVQNTPWDKK